LAERRFSFSSLERFFRLCAGLRGPPPMFLAWKITAALDGSSNISADGRG
jgi:hypothetical protein